MYQKFQNIFSEDEICDLYNKANECLHKVHSDYFSELDFLDYCKTYLGHYSIVSKCLAYRFFDKNIFERLKESLCKKVFNEYEVDDLYIHPIFYLRFTFPDLYVNQLQKEAYLCVPPHYDYTYKTKAFSLWMPLVDINDDDGGIVFFKKSQDIKNTFKLFENSRNRYNYNSYLENAHQLDPVIKNNIEKINFKKGDICLFDEQELHAAAKALKTWRVSFDLRIIAKEDAHNTSNESFKEFLLKWNNLIDICSICNLIMCGDYIGASEKMRKLSVSERSILCDELAHLYMLKPPENKFMKKHSRIYWQDEYFWLLKNIPGYHDLINFRRN